MGNWLSKNTISSKEQEELSVQIREQIKKPSLLYNKGFSEEDLKAETNISVLSYNILADAYTNAGHFPFSDARALDFKERSLKIIEQLRVINADIICLQECDNFKGFYKLAIENLGYEIFYEKRPQSLDGCLIGLKKSRGLRIIESSVRDMDTKHRYTTDGRFIRGNIAYYLRLKDERNDNRIINLVNTHFHWNPRFDFVKYLQMYLMLQLLSENVKEEEAIIFCGDLNSLPNSNAVHMVLTGEPPKDERCEHQITEDERSFYAQIYDDYLKLRPKFSLSASYGDYKSLTVEGEKGFPDYTNYVAIFKGTIDHIFYTSKILTPICLLELPSAEQIKNKSLPNLQHPSDHLPIMATFRFEKA